MVTNFFLSIYFKVNISSGLKNHSYLLYTHVISQFKSHGRKEVKSYSRILIKVLLFLNRGFWLLFTSKIELRSFLGTVRKSIPIHNIINPVKI